MKMDEQQVEDIVKCSDCGSRSLSRDETRGEVVCDDCGLVLEDNVIDQGAEWACLFSRTRRPASPYWCTYDRYASRQGIVYGY